MPTRRADRIVRFVPALPPDALKRRPRSTTLPFPFDQIRLLFTFSGTAAIYQAAKTLRLPRYSPIRYSALSLAA